MKYLADMNVTAAVEDIRSWLEFLKQSSPYDNEMTSILIKGAKEQNATWQS